MRTFLILSSLMLAGVTLFVAMPLAIAGIEQLAETFHHSLVAP